VYELKNNTHNPPRPAKFIKMLEAASDVLTFANGRQRSELDVDRQLLLSIVKSNEIIGEAAG